MEGSSQIVESSSSPLLSASILFTCTTRHQQKHLLNAVIHNLRLREEAQKCGGGRQCMCGQHRILPETVCLQPHDRPAPFSWVKNYWYSRSLLLLTWQVRKLRKAGRVTCLRSHSYKPAKPSLHLNLLNQITRWGRDSKVFKYSQRYYQRLQDLGVVVGWLFWVPDARLLLPPILPFPVLSFHIYHRWPWCGGHWALQMKNQTCLQSTKFTVQAWQQQHQVSPSLFVLPRPTTISQRPSSFSTHLSSQ